MQGPAVLTCRVFCCRDRAVVRPSVSARSAICTPAPPDMVTAPIRRPVNAARTEQRFDDVEHFAFIRDADNTILRSDALEHAGGRGKRASMGRSSLGPLGAIADLGENQRLAGFRRAPREPNHLAPIAEVFDIGRQNVDARVVNRGLQHVPDIKRRFVAGVDEPAKANPLLPREPCDSGAERPGLADECDRGQP